MLEETLLRELFDSAVRRSGTVGAQLSIVQGDQQLDFAAGLAHAERGLEMTPDTLMQIGSITKVFNAVNLLALREVGCIDLDVPVREYLPTFRVADPLASQSLTLRHLLSMSSGLDNGPYVYFGAGDDALPRYVEHLASLPQHFQPGRHFGYSNAGSCIAGAVASRVTGKPWESMLREQILEPAGLHHAAALDEDLQSQQISVGHIRAGNGKPTIVEPMLSRVRARAPSGASLALSTRDLAHLGRMFIGKGIASTGIRVLSQESVVRMQGTQVLTPVHKYGTAWCLGACSAAWSGVAAFGHAGTTATSTSYLYWFPERKGVIAFNVNTPAAMAEFADVAFGEILKAAFGFSKPRIDVPQDPLGLVDPRRYEGVYEERGMRLHVTVREGKSLGAHFVPQRTAQELSMQPQLLTQSERSAYLTPLGSDRFRVDWTQGPDPHRGVIDMAFFGDDGRGRATNALNLVFPMSRID